ncbi:PilN domain-containing protein [Serratia sp. OS31]|uniref:PilN domain-containing protein n=1 Tax=Serratia sp. OS31 TaxID=2760844 RepID=UPI001600839F|nr:PilN domain-containing protein [Serratia sp. OS31]MBB1583339.1 PilN domain-containing protein [Serratia sp. OS31]
MYQVNLLPWRACIQRRRAAFWLRLFVLQLVLGLAALMGAYGLLSQQQEQQHQALLALARQQAELTGRYQQRQQAMIRLANLTAQAEQHGKNLAHNRRHLNLLQQLSALLPAPLWLSALESNAHNLTLRGLSHRYEAVTQFEQQLTALPLLRRGQLAEVVQRQDGLFSFSLVAQWGRDE